MIAAYLVHRYGVASANAQSKPLLDIGQYDGHTGAGQGMFTSVCYCVSVCPKTDNVWGSDCVLQVFNSDAKFLFCAAEKRFGDTKSYPLGVAFNETNGEVYVADVTSNQVIVCNGGGALVRELTLDFRSPFGLTMCTYQDKQHLIVSELNGHVVKIVDCERWQGC